MREEQTTKRQLKVTILRGENNHNHETITKQNTTGRQSKRAVTGYVNMVTVPNPYLP